jgi:hypothetical protein
MGHTLALDWQRRYLLPLGFRTATDLSAWLREVVIWEAVLNDRNWPFCAVPNWLEST